jgi:MFS family permease
MTATAPAARVRAFPASRLAVSLLFLLNGFIVGSWAPKIPEFAKFHGLSEGQLGLMIVGFGVGSLVSMPMVGALIAREGSRRIARFLAALTAFSLLAITLAPNIAVAALTVILLGATAGGMDVAMNANAVAVEKSMGRAIMSSCHGFWSLGGLIGASAGGWLIGKLGVMNHVLLVTIIACGLVALAWAIVFNDEAPPHEDKPPVKLPLVPLPWLVGIMALFSMIPEGAVMDWGALYLRDELGGTVTQSGFVFGAFSATMAVMRFAGDAVRDSLGAVITMRICAIIAFTGMIMAGLAPSPFYVIAGFAFAGIGISNLVPIAFSAAGNLPGLPPGIGLSIVTFMGYSGALFAPTTLGFIAEYTGFAAIFTALPFLLLVVLALSGLARYADMNHQERA